MTFLFSDVLCDGNFHPSTEHRRIHNSEFCDDVIVALMMFVRNGDCSTRARICFDCNWSFAHFSCVDIMHCADASCVITYLFLS